MAKTLLSTFYSLEPVMVCITRFSPNRIVLLREEEVPVEKKKAEKTLKEIVGGIMEVKVRETSLYDVLKVAEDVVDIIDDERAEARALIANISGGRKPQALGLLFGCYARNQDVQEIVYVAGKTNKIVKVPVIGFRISKNKKRILEELGKGKNVKEIAGELGITITMVYNHIRDLRGMGLICQKNHRITMAGKISIL